MKRISSEKNILKIIKYVPLLFIIIASIMTTFYISYNYSNNLKNEKMKIEKEYLDFNKNIIQTNINNIYKYINNKNNFANGFFKDEIKQRVYNAHLMMTSIYEKFKDTRTKEEIILIIKTALRNIKLTEGRGYYFIYDLKGTSIFHPFNPQREGKNFFNVKDSNGSFILQESVAIAKSKKGEGYRRWFFPKANGSMKEYEKIGFIKKFEPYNWFIGMGEYKEDFENQIKMELIKYIKDLGYKDTGYIFVIDKKGNLLLTDTKLSKVSDIYNKNEFVKPYYNFINSEKEDIYLKYKYISKNGVSPIKISYLKKIKRYDWVIGTGFNLNNLNLKIKEKQKELEDNYDNNIRVTLISASIMTFLFIIISIVLSKLLKKKFLEYKRSLEIEIKKNQKQKETLLRAQKIARIGDWELNVKTKEVFYSDQVIKILDISEKDRDKFGPEFLKTIMLNEDIPYFEKSLNKCINEGKEHKCIYRIKKPNDKIRWIECRGKLDENKLYIIGTIQDITESKDLEIEKQQKDEILYQQTKMAAMGEMIGNIAHQWRQPLSTISTAATGTKIQKEMDCLSDEQLYTALTAINNSAQHLSTTIDDFRAFFDPRNNKVTEFNIFGTFQSALTLIKSQFISEEIEIIQNIENIKLSSMENELKQVLINILNNARDELVKIKNKRRIIFINTYKKDNILYIEILDNAGGIKKDIINRIFEPYFTTKGKIEGTGIGLYMSKEIIEKHLNAKLSVSNENYIFEDIEYIGAKFTIKITDSIKT